MGNRTYSQYQTDVARGLLDSHSLIHKFGRNENMGTAEADVWNVGGIHIFPTSAYTIELISSSTNDDSGGSGATHVTIEGLNENFEEITDVISMNGQSATATSSGTYIRVNRAWVSGVGAYSNSVSGSNLGDITIRHTTTTSVQALISANVGQTQKSHYTVPASKTAYVQNVVANVDSAKTATISFWKRKNADVVTAPFTSKRNVFKLNGVSGVNEFSIDFPMNDFPAKTDVWFSGTAGVGGTAVEIDYEIELIKVGR